MTDRTIDLEERLKRQYDLLKQKEFALDTEPQVTKGEVRLLINRLKEEIVEVEQEYAQRLTQQVKRQDFPEDAAAIVVTELVDEIELIQPRDAEMKLMLQEVLDELRRPETPAAAKLKMAIPLIPGIVAIELEGDAESITRRLFPTFVKVHRKLKAMAAEGTVKK
jgi:hypothetical protein